MSCCHGHVGKDAGAARSVSPAGQPPQCHQEPQGQEGACTRSPAPALLAAAILACSIFLGQDCALCSDAPGYLKAGPKRVYFLCFCASLGYFEGCKAARSPIIKAAIKNKKSSLHCLSLDASFAGEAAPPTTYSHPPDDSRGGGGELLTCFAKLGLILPNLAHILLVAISLQSKLFFLNASKLL